MIGWDDLLDGYLEESVEVKVGVNALKADNLIAKEILFTPEADDFFDEFLNCEPATTTNEQFDSTVVVDEAFTSIVPRFEGCKICFKPVSEDEQVLCCFGCSDFWHRNCVAGSSKALCPLPNILRFAHHVTEKLVTHAPWYCNSCVSCSKCKTSWTKCACCRKCGKSFCLSCLRESGLTSRSFQNLSNFACDSCSECINCGCAATIRGKQLMLYDDNRFCRPCYLSSQIGAVCPLCEQIYHWLPLRSDYGDVPYDDEFATCPMIECDGCGEWVHAICEGLSDEEYDRLGRDKRRKFYCFKCRKEGEDGKESVCNLISCNDSQSTSFAFKFRNPLDAWIVTIFKLFYGSEMFTLSTEDESFSIKAPNFYSLVSQFKDSFSSDELIDWKSSVRFESFFKPRRLLPRLPASLLTEISKLLPETCARTAGYKKRERPAWIDTSIPRTRASLKSMHLAQSMNVSRTNATTGSLHPTLLYMQYLNAVRQDDSGKTVDAFTLGVALRPSRIAGFGLFAAKAFPSGSLIIEYCGEMLHSDRLVNRRDAYYNALGSRFRQSCYLFRLDDERVLDATLKGNLSRFINHSCDPNCYSRVVSFEAKVKKLLIFALKDIEAGEEIVYDYKFPEDEGEKINCHCGALKCRGYLN